MRDVFTPFLLVNDLLMDAEADIFVDLLHKSVSLLSVTFERNEYLSYL